MKESSSTRTSSALRLDNERRGREIGPARVKEIPRGCSLGVALGSARTLPCATLREDIMNKGLTGKFNKLTVLQFDHKGNHGVSFYKFKCDCGVEKVLCGADVVRGKTKSCGCNRSRYISQAHLLPEGQAAFNSLYSLYAISCARSRGLEFSLSKEEFLKLTKEACHYCGVSANQVWKGTSRVCSPYVYNGIDRKDNKQGYTLNNCVACCKVCNIAKGAMSLDAFLAWIDRLVNFRNTLKVPVLKQGE
jgi:hypothetical protein